MKVRLKKNKRIQALISGLILLGVIAIVITGAFVTFILVDKNHHDNRTLIAVVMLAFIAFSAFIGAVLDFVRRHYLIDKPVREILEATDKIAEGDFSVRMPIRKSLKMYNELDLIKENINKMSEGLSHNEVLRTDFISNVSHELKTPLAIIQNYATYLQNKNLDEKTRTEYARVLSDTAERFSILITNILKLNKLENQDISTEYSTFNVSEALAQAVIGIDGVLESKGLELECDIEEDVTITSDLSYLELVWNNLISNAVKFTESGGTIGISLKKNGEKVIISVSDTGCGISPETGKHIFEKFYQGDTSHSMAGNGLGLALVKKVIDILGGDIAVESELGKGSVFTVSIVDFSGRE